jgi:hypothetical protein
MPSSDLVRVEREKRKAAREARSWEREKILYERVLTPNMTRLIMVAGIIAYSTYCARSKENVGPVQSALAFALPGIGIPLIAADAGIRDKYALAGISAAGIGYTTGQMLEGWKQSGVIPSGGDLWEQFKNLFPEWAIPG